MSLLHLEDVGKIYVSDGSVAVGIRHVTLDFDIGEFVAVTGKSGSGKTTLLNVLSGMDTFEEGELFALGVHISPYEKGNIFNRQPLRPKKLMMHKKELMRLFGKVSQQGLTLIPLSLYLSGPYVKVELGLCQGKKLYDKRATDAKRQAERTIERYTKGKNQAGE